MAASSMASEADRLTVAGASSDSHWLELSRKRSASGSCLSPHSSKPVSPDGRSKHSLYLTVELVFFLLLLLLKND